MHILLDTVLMKLLQIIPKCVLKVRVMFWNHEFFSVFRFHELENESFPYDDSQYNSRVIFDVDHFLTWLVRSTPERAFRFRAVAGDALLCSWARHLTFTVPLSAQEYEWVPANCWGNLTNCLGVTCDELTSRPGGVEILLAASCYRNRDKLWQL